LRLFALRRIGGKPNFIDIAGALRYPV